MFFTLLEYTAAIGRSDVLLFGMMILFSSLWVLLSVFSGNYCHSYSFYSFTCLCSQLKEESSVSGSEEEADDLPNVDTDEDASDANQNNIDDEVRTWNNCRKLANT